MGILNPPEGFKSSQQALLDLERSKVPPVELLDEVAQILGVKYGTLESANFHQTKGGKESPDLTGSAPKEEWVLRWLLKRSGLSSLGGGKFKISDEDASRYGLRFLITYNTY